MDTKRVEYLRRVYKLTLSIPGELAVSSAGGKFAGELSKGGAYTMVYKYVRGNTNFLSPADDDPHGSTAARHVLVCHFLLGDVFTNGAFTKVVMTQPDVYACTSEVDMERMRVFLALTSNVFEFPTCTLGSDVRIFTRSQLESAIKMN